MARRIFITGGAGFIGSNFIRYIISKSNDIQIINYDSLTYAGNLMNLIDIENNDNYHFIKGDICDKETLYTTLKELSPDYIINFAAESHVDKSIENPDQFVKTNINGVNNLLKCSLELDINKFIQISTDEVCGSLDPAGVFTENSPILPRNPYSATKAAAEHLVKAYFYTYDLPINITRCSNNYGPYQFPEKLIPLTIVNCLNKKNIRIYGDGKQTRDWIHVLDHCSGIKQILDKGRNGEIYTISANVEMTNLEIVTKIIKEVSEIMPKLGISDELITFVDDRKGHDRRYANDASKIRKELKWKPTIDFDEGLRNTVKWYLDNQDWIKSIITKEYQNYNDEHCEIRERFFC